MKRADYERETEGMTPAEFYEYRLRRINDLRGSALEMYSSGIQVAVESGSLTAEEGFRFMAAIAKRALELFDAE